jgi:hypothetical protein
LALADNPEMADWLDEAEMPLHTEQLRSSSSMIQFDDPASTDVQFDDADINGVLEAMSDVSAEPSPKADSATQPPRPQPPTTFSTLPPPQPSTTTAQPPAGHWEHIQPVPLDQPTQPPMTFPTLSPPQPSRTTSQPLVEAAAIHAQAAPIAAMAQPALGALRAALARNGVTPPVATGPPKARPANEAAERFRQALRTAAATASGVAATATPRLRGKANTAVSTPSVGLPDIIILGDNASASLENQVTDLFKLGDMRKSMGKTAFEATPFGSSIKKIEQLLVGTMMPKILAAHDSNQKELVGLAH